MQSMAIRLNHDIHDVSDKFKKEELKKYPYNAPVSSACHIVDIVALKTRKIRSQTFAVVKKLS